MWIQWWSRPSLVHSMADVIVAVAVRRPLGQRGRRPLPPERRKAAASLPLLGAARLRCRVDLPSNQPARPRCWSAHHGGGADGIVSSSGRRVGDQAAHSQRWCCRLAIERSDFPLAGGRRWSRSSSASPAKLSAAAASPASRTLIDTIRRFIDRCQPFTWAKDADTIPRQSTMITQGKRRQQTAHRSPVQHTAQFSQGQGDAWEAMRKGRFEVACFE